MNMHVFNETDSPSSCRRISQLATMNSIQLITVIIIIIITTTKFVVLSSWPKSLREFTLIIWWMQTERRVPPTLRPSESVENRQLPSTSTITIVLITQPIDWYLLYRTTESGRLNLPRHCSKGAQPVPKAVYCSSCCDKHNRPQCDSNLDPLTLQSDMLPLGYWGLY